MGLAGAAREYGSYSFKELVKERDGLVEDIHRQFASGKGLDQCFKSLSSEQSTVVFNAIQNLSGVLEELNTRRHQRKSKCFCISYDFCLIVLKGFLHLSFLTAIALDFTSIFLDCKKANYLEIASIVCATTAVALAILNKWGEVKLARRKQDLARLENCSVDELPGIKQFNLFLNSFIELVAFLQLREEEKKSRHSSNSGSDDSGSYSSHPLPQATRTFLAAKAAALGLKELDKKMLARVCISNLFAVPDYILEKYAKENAAIIRENWITQIATMAKIKYEASNSERGLEYGASMGEIKHSVDIDISEIEPSTDFSKLSLNKLIQLYQEEIINFHEKFNLNVYLANFVSDIQENESSSEFQEQKQIVDSFIAKLKNLQQVIRDREKIYQRTHCIPCLSTKRKEDVLYGAKHLSTIVFFAATSISGVTHCEEGFGVRDAGKVIAMISGIFCMFLEGLCSWTTSRDLNNKLERASLLNADIFDLESFDRFNDFVDSFLIYAERIKGIKGFIDAHKSSADEDFAKQELRARMEIIKESLEKCEDILKSIDNGFLEHLIKGNGSQIKKEWQKSLRQIFEKLTESVHLEAYRKNSSLAPKKLSLTNIFNYLTKNENLEQDGAQTVKIIELPNGENDIFEEDGISVEEESDEEILYDNECVVTMPKAEEKAETSSSGQFCHIQ